MELKEQKCPYCGGTNLKEIMSVRWAVHTWTGPVTRLVLYHVICMSCGTDVRTYVEQDNLEKLRLKLEELEDRSEAKKPRPKGKIRKNAEKIFLVPDPEEDEEE